MKKIAFLSFLFILLASFVSPVLAENILLDRGSKQAPKTDRVQDRTTASTSARANLEERLAQEITRRITLLEKLLTRIGESEWLTSVQKTDYSAQVQAEIDAMLVLQEESASITDQVTLQTYIKELQDSHQRFILILPKIHLVIAAERIIHIVDEMTTLSTTLEEKIAEQGANGVDTTDADALLSDMKAKLIDAQTQAENAKNLVANVSSGDTEKRTVLQNARQLIVAAVRNLNAARQDARKIIVWIVENGGTKPERSTTVTTTPSANSL